MKLSNAIRDKAIADVLKSKFEETESALESQLKDLVEAEVIKREAGYPLDAVKPFLKKDTDVRILDGNQVLTIKGNKYRYWTVRMKNQRPLMSNEDDYINVQATEEIKRQVQAIEKVQPEKEELEKVLRAVLYSCTTTKQVIETAPELEKFLPDEKAPTTALVAMETVRKLRQALQGGQ